MAKTKPKRSPWRRRLLAAAVGSAVALGGLWVAIHEVPWVGPALADGTRALIGPEPVAWAEDVAYGVADEVNVWLYGDAEPTTFWEAPEAPTEAASAPAPLPVAATADAPVALPAEPPAFPPPRFEAPFEKVRAEGDGVWVAIADPERPSDAPLLAKSVVHPDPRRPFAAIAVVAIDLTRAELHMLAGTKEPESMRVPRDRRPGLIPPSHYESLVAAFNGGFKAVHGHYGMRMGEDTFVVPRDVGCTIAFYQTGSIGIGTWSSIKSRDSEMDAYRQTPPCLVEDGETHVGLGQEYNRAWGAAVDGDTIIRRSAMGIAADGKTLFYGLGEAVTAQSLGRGMSAVGARNVAELDINYSYPRFLFFGHTGHESGEPRVKSGIIKDLKYKAEDYIIEPSTRDFFYLTRRSPTS